MDGFIQRHDDGAELYRSFLSGDGAAFDRIIEIYHDSLIHYIYGLIHNIADAEDIAEDVFCELLVHKGRFTFKSSLKTYLFSIAKNKSVDLVRKSRHLSDKEFEEGTAEIADVHSIEESVVTGEEAKLVRDVLGEINPDYAEILRLTYFYDFSYDEICKITGKTKRQIANLLYRGKASMREALEKRGVNAE